MSQIATKDSWNISSMDQQKQISFFLLFDEYEFDRIRMGYVPAQMEQKWFVYFDDGWLHVHRSWTGYETSWIVLDGKPVQSVSGGGHFGGGMFINAYDMARFGLLNLNKGIWNTDG